MSDRKLTSEMLLGAYASGVFPMAETRDDPDIFWVDPRHRGVLPLDNFHVSRSLSRAMRQPGLEPRINAAFEAVLEGCADREETWINDTIHGLMMDLHRRGFAHSFEIWREDMLIGGMYGVALGAAFFGESMFSAADNGSKITLALAVDHLSRAGFTLFDTQFLTDHLASLGAIEIPRADYRRALSEALDIDADVRNVSVETDLQAVVQRVTQTS